MSTLAFQGACLEHIIAIARGTGLLEQEVLDGAMDARKTLGWFERHEELTKAYHKLWKENPEGARAMSAICRAFPGAEIRNSMTDDHYEIGRDA